MVVGFLRAAGLLVLLAYSTLAHAALEFPPPSGRESSLFGTLQAFTGASGADIIPSDSSFRSERAGLTVPASIQLDDQLQRTYVDSAGGSSSAAAAYTSSLTLTPERVAFQASGSVEYDVTALTESAVISQLLGFAYFFISEPHNYQISAEFDGANEANRNFLQIRDDSNSILAQFTDPDPLISGPQISAQGVLGPGSYLLLFQTFLDIGAGRSRTAPLVDSESVSNFAVFTAAPVPLPPAVLLLLAALGGPLAYARMRGRRACGNIRRCALTFKPSS